MPSSSIGTVQVARLAGVERDQRPEEGRVLDDHRVARVEQQLGHQVQALLAALQ